MRSKRDGSLFLQVDGKAARRQSKIKEELQ